MRAKLVESVNGIKSILGAGFPRAGLSCPIDAELPGSFDKRMTPTKIRATNIQFLSTEGCEVFGDGGEFNDSSAVAAEARRKF